MKYTLRHLFKKPGKKDPVDIKVLNDNWDSLDEKLVSKAGESEGTDLSMVTTGEKYIWDHPEPCGFPYLGIASATSTDFNELTKVGWYRTNGTAMTNGPDSYTYGELFCFTYGQWVRSGGRFFIRKHTGSPATWGPWVDLTTDTTYSAGAGLTLDGTTFKMVRADVSEALNLLGAGNTAAIADTTLIGCYDPTDSTAFTRRKASSIVNATLVKAALGTDGSTATQCLTKKGTWATFGTSNLEIGTSAATAAAGNHTHNAMTMNRTSTGNWLNLQGNGTQVGRLYWGTEGVANTEGWSYLYLGNANASTLDGNCSGQIRLFNKAGGYARLSGAYGSLGGTNRNYIYIAEYLKSTQVWGAVWNDYAEMRKCKAVEAGRCVTETENGTMALTEGRLQAGCRIVSDTYGFCIGETKEAKTPIAVCGRVLAYPFKDPSGYHLGDAVCSAPNGTVDIMTREEIREYPERIIGTISEIPKYKTWVAGSEGSPTEIPVNGRIWIYVR